MLFLYAQLSYMMAYFFHQCSGSKLIVSRESSLTVTSVLTAKHKERETQSVCGPLHFGQFLCTQFPPVCNSLCRVEEERLSVTGRRRQKGAQVSPVSVGCTQGGHSAVQEGLDFSLFWKIQQVRGEKTEEKEGRQGTMAADVRFKLKTDSNTRQTGRQVTEQKASFINIKVHN